MNQMHKCLFKFPAIDVQAVSKSNEYSGKCNQVCYSKQETFLSEFERVGYCGLPHVNQIPKRSD